MKIRLLLADDHPALLSGLVHELKAIPTLDILGTAQDSGALVELLQANACDVLITDYVMPGGKYGDGIGLLSYIKRAYPQLKIVVFTTMENPALTQELARLGVNAVLGKTQHTNQLISAIHAVYAGSNYFPSENLVTGESGISQNPGANLSLTKREFEVVRLFASGLSINEIASQLHRTKQTISSQKASAMRKLGITRDADLFRYAFESGLAVPLPPDQTP
ncbi:response regulator transcription factor [Pseudomonas citronellolis]|jgi:two-component system capsular synthesis response regulator RcsB|uniref:response regulator transcription factor n=1 Tax=Pseudomonas citronellolis TaxID=53408 RepID=UPI00226F17EA|nr:response regulator transcription factor [Pseudomonas citronellolis]WAB90266.1 response regulator transcription factor [Pseudomonas citronellolis]WRT82511.1 response regulator transcription factor [Pseudomonas citronellolis]